MAAEYAELHCHTNFSFLEGASHPEDLAVQAAELGLTAVAATDHNGLYGSVRFGRAARSQGLAAVVGAEVALQDADGRPIGHLVLLVENAAGYANLCQLISRSQMAGRKGEPRLDVDLLRARLDGLVCLSGCRQGPLARLLQQGKRREAQARAVWLRDLFGPGRFWVEIQRHLLPGDSRLVGDLVALAERVRVGYLATNTVLYARPEGRRLQDVLTCVKHHTTLDRAGSLLRPNGEFFLKSPAEMAERFADLPEALKNTKTVAERCTFRMEDLGHTFPTFPVPEGETAFSYLHHLCHEGARRRYQPVSPPVMSQLSHELGIIEKLHLAEYFLVVWDLMRFAREQGILGQGRGSAANSIVAYVLGITNVDPIKLDLLFERFLSEGRSSPPDIDVDFANKDREKVIQYLYERYGREHAGMVCEVITYRPRSAVRDVGKALGLSLEQVDVLAKSLDHYSWTPQAKERTRDAVGPVETAAQMPGSAPEDSLVDTLNDLCQQIEGFPRHLGIHSGGMVITRQPLLEVVPLEWATMPGRTVAQWDKDDLEDLGLIKIDLLGLGMLSLIQDCLKLIEQHHGKTIDLSTLGYDDPAVYDTLCKADTVGLFQVESRAQMSTLPRLKPRTFYDLIVEISLIRPGPIQGQMVHPYLRRRAGEEPVTYPHPSLQPLLEKTLGVPLFQEQGMKLAIQAAGFTPAQADELRRTMGHKRSRERMNALREALMDGMATNGITGQAAETIWTQLSSFADYGFPESHAASFAHIVYASAWLRQYYPAEFTCAILNNQPMGFYPPAVLVGDARRHGVRILPVDVNRSRASCTIEKTADEDNMVRLGLRYVKGVGESAFARLDAESERGPYRSLVDVCGRSGLDRKAIEALIAVGALGSLEGGKSRRELLWALPAALEEARQGSLPGLVQPSEAVDLGEPTAIEAANADYMLLGLSPTWHAMEFYRERLRQKGVRCADELASLPHRSRVTVGGLVIVRQAPPTAKGHVFLSLEDETGMSNVVIRPQVYAREKNTVRGYPVLLVTGELHREEGVLNIIAQSFAPLDASSLGGTVPSRDFH